MKIKSLFLAFTLLAAGHQFAPAANLPFGTVTSFVGNSCWYEPSAPSVVVGTFTLPGVQGVGTVQSSLFYAIQNNGLLGGTGPIYTYFVDTSGMSAPTSHNIQLAVYFGTPVGVCSGNQVMVLTNAGFSPLQTATESLSTIYFTFGSSPSPYLHLGQTSSGLAMISDQDPKTNSVTIIDDYVDPASGFTNHYSTKVTAIVPDIPPIYLSPLPPLYQGVLQQRFYGTNAVPMPSGTYDLGMQLYTAASNGLPIGPMMTQSITVSNGLFNAPMNFDPGAFFGKQRWLSLSIRPPGSNTFTTLNPPQPISPTPQSVYAYTAGTVADLSPGQAVTSLNGLTDAVTLQAGSGITFNTNGNTLVINTLPAGISDRHLKTNFASINPQDVLRRVVGLPVQTWSYTNEQPDVRHMGPMAQDFRDAFKLGDNDKLIGYLDETGVALAAIQGLNQKLQEKDTALSEQSKEIKELNSRIQKLEQMAKDKNAGAK